MASRERFKHESLQDNQSIVKYLEALGQGFAGGEITFTSDNESLALKPQGLINMEVECRRKSGEIKLSLKFRWAETDGEPEAPPSPLSIQAGSDKD